MKRIFPFILIFTVISLTLCACKDGQTPTTPTDITQTQTQTQPQATTITQSTTEKSEVTATTAKNETQLRTSKTTTSSTNATIHFSSGNTKKQNESTAYTVNNVLTADQLEIYHDILNAVKSHEDLVDLGNVRSFDIIYAYNAVNKYNPSVFWFPLEYELIRYNGGYNLRFHYNYTKEQISGMSARIETQVQLLLNEIKGDDEYSIALQIHDALCNKISYDTQFQAESFNIFGALVNKSATCEGYSRAYQYLLSLKGIRCVLVGGNVGNEGHLWNKVCINGSWYNTDITLDDSDDKSNHFYFNRTDAEFLSDHTCDRTIGRDDGTQLPYSMEFNMALPVCTAQSDNYYIKNDRFIISDDSFNDVISNALTGEIVGVYEFGTSQSFGCFPKTDTAEYEALKSKIVDSVRAVTDKEFAFYGVHGGYGFAVVFDD